MLMILLAALMKRHVIIMQKQLIMILSYANMQKKILTVMAIAYLKLIAWAYVMAHL